MIIWIVLFVLTILTILIWRTAKNTRALAAIERRRFERAWYAEQAAFDRQYGIKRDADGYWV